MERRPYRAARRDASPHHAVATERDPPEGDRRTEYGLECQSFACISRVAI